jgi:hypothetical protein
MFMRLSSTSLVSAIAKLLDRRDRLRRDLKALGACGQLGNGILGKPASAVVAALKRPMDARVTYRAVAVPEV